MRIGPIKILISQCTVGIYLRWWFNGWHYFLFTNGYEVTMKTESMDTQVSRMFSRISKIERPTRLKAEYSYQVTLEGITASNIPGFTGLLMAERVDQYDNGKWYEVDITRGDHLIKDENAPGYILNFEITRKELPNTPSVYQKSLRLYLGNILCDMDDDEVVPINKQTNDIAEMQDRQSDFTAQFKIRKTRAMRALFELSGEAGIDSNFPFEDKECKLIQDNIEVITGGIIILDKVDEQYYYVSILSGNKNFFKTIERLKLKDLSLGTTNHTWNVATMAATHVGDPDYVYPLCEPSEDGSIDPLTDDGDRVEMYGGWIWPFIKVKAIWDEIFVNTGFVCEGDILTDNIFTKLFMPIVNLDVENTYPYLYSLYNNATLEWVAALNMLTGGTLIKGDFMFGHFGFYIVPFTATYKIKVTLVTAMGVIPTVYFRDGLTDTELPLKSSRIILGWRESIYEGEVTGTTPDWTFIVITPCTTIYYDISIVEISKAQIGYGSPVTPHVNLPDISQTEFIKMICNMFALIPDVDPRTRIVKFWNFKELYDNIPIARDWSTYLSEYDDEMEFKFGEYAQDNYMRYKESDDVIKDNGMGTMQIDDETLPSEKDVVELPISTCDEVNILPYTLPAGPHLFQVTVSRIGFNKWNIDDSSYDQNKTIDPRIVYIDYTKSIGSPLYEKTLWLRDTILPLGGEWLDEHIDSPKKASSIEVSFPYLISNYAGLSRLLTKTNLRRAKFNLPVYEVAGLKHYIPIYLSQYKAYFYVNKINNYVPGQLCIIDLIKL